MGNLLNDPGYLAAIATFLTALLVGVLFNDKAKAREGAVGLMVLAAIIAVASYVTQSPQPASAVQKITKQQEARINNHKDEAISQNVLPKPPEKQVDSIPGHNDPPRLNGDLVKIGTPSAPPAPSTSPIGNIADKDVPPPSTFNPSSNLPTPRLPTPLPINPNRQMPVTMRPVPTPDNYVPKGNAQTVNPSQVRWVQLPNGTWELRPYLPPNNSR